MNNIDYDIFPLPISDEIKDQKMIENFFLGNVSAKALSNAMQKWMKDPVYFFDFWYKYSNKNNHLKEIIEGSYLTINSSFELIFNNFDEYIKSYSSYKDSQRNLRKQFFKSDPEIQGAFRNLLDTKPIEKKKLEWIPIDFDKSIKGTNYFNYFFSRSLELRRIPKKSDIGDLLHLFYHNQTDILRVDKTKFKIMCDCEINRNDVLCDKLIDLPSKIRMKSLDKKQ